MSHPSSVHCVRFLSLGRVEPHLMLLKERWCQSCHCSTLSSAATHEALGICELRAEWKTIIALNGEHCVYLAPWHCILSPVFSFCLSTFFCTCFLTAWDVALPNVGLNATMKTELNLLVNVKTLHIAEYPSSTD